MKEAIVMSVCDFFFVIAMAGAFANAVIIAKLHGYENLGFRNIEKPDRVVLVRYQIFECLFWVMIGFIVLSLLISEAISLTRRMMFATADCLIIIPITIGLLRSLVQKEIDKGE